MRGLTSATIGVLQNGNGTATVLRDEESMNLRRRGAAVAGGVIGFVAVTLWRRRRQTPIATVPVPSA